MSSSYLFEVPKQLKTVTNIIMMKNAADLITSKWMDDRYQYVYQEREREREHEMR